MDGDVENDRGDMSSVYVLKNIHTLSQCEYSSNFKDVYGGVENGDVSSGYGFINIYTDL